MKTKSSRDAAESLARQIFDPKEWQAEIVNRVVPILAVAMIEAMNAQVDLIKRGTKAFCGIQIKGNTTATEFLEKWNLDLEDVVFNTPYGDISLGMATEMPAWMKSSIKDLLKETFEMPYWEDVNLSTLGDITKYLEKGLLEGQSIEKMAKSMAPDLIEEGQYATVRGRRIARTESGHALNGARTAAYDQLKADLEEELPIQKSWLSVLGTTTRLTHADLDGVPANSEGVWVLAGIKTRWPGDTRLPPEERINCQCTVVTEFGMQDAEAYQLIEEYDLRVREEAGNSG